MKVEDKKNLLTFCTGSDRVPIKGLAALEFTISRNGPDSDRLPTSHTWYATHLPCFVRFVAHVALAVPVPCAASITCFYQSTPGACAGLALCFHFFLRVVHSCTAAR
jgi:hypothetical protein